VAIFVGHGPRQPVILLLTAGQPARGAGRVWLGREQIQARRRQAKGGSLIASLLKLAGWPPGLAQASQHRARPDNAGSEIAGLNCG